MQGINLRPERRRLAAVVDPVVGNSEPRFAGGLRGENGKHLFAFEVASPYHALNLDLDRAVDHEQTMCPFAPGARLHQ
jgi:hypothetical protein